MNRRKMVLALSFIALSSACVSYQYSPVPGNSQVTQILAARKETLRITRISGGQLELRAPRLQGDTVVGMDAYGDTRIAVPMSDVKLIETRKISRGQSVAGTGAALAATALFGFMFIGMSVSSGWH